MCFDPLLRERKNYVYYGGHSVLTVPEPTAGLEIDPTPHDFAPFAIVSQVIYSYQTVIAKL